jgi:hypothetical protein
MCKKHLVDKMIIWAPSVVHRDFNVVLYINTISFEYNTPKIVFEPSVVGGRPNYTTDIAI